MSKNGVFGLMKNDVTTNESEKTQKIVLYFTARWRNYWLRVKKGTGGFLLLAMEIGLIFGVTWGGRSRNSNNKRYVVRRRSLREL